MSTPTPGLNLDLYPAKEQFDQFVSSLPKDGTALPSTKQADLAFMAWRLYQEGLPHRDRPMCLYYFYHFLPFYREAEMGDKAEALYEASISSVVDPQIRKYMTMLDGEKLYEVCDQRGKLKLVESRLVEFSLDNSLLSQWESIRQTVEDFIGSEPITSPLFLESYMFGAQHYCHQTKRPYAKLYEIANQVLNTSTDLRAINIARSLVHDEDNLRAYQRTQCQPRDAKKILSLEALEQEVMSEFGHALTIRTKLGKALGMITKAGREQRAAEKDYQSQWVARIRGTGQSSMPYIAGYAEYLCSWVYMGTDDIKKAIKSLERALECGFNPGLVLTFLYNINDTLKNNNDAARWAQKLLDYTNVESAEEAEQSDFDQALVLTIRAAGQQPKFAKRFWDEIATTNSARRPSVIAGLQPKIQAARNENIQERTNVGIALLDRLIPVALTDKALNEGKSLADVPLELARSEFASLSLEEIELFRNAGKELLLKISSGAANLQTAIDYIKRLHDLRFTDIGRDFNPSMAAFPNLVAAIPTLKELILQCTRAGHLDAGTKLAEFAIGKRSKGKVVGFYEAIRPLQKALHQDRPLTEEIDLIAKSRKILQPKEMAEATTDLKEAYVAALGVETSLTKKDRLLKAAASEGLSDERLSAMRVEVDSLLQRRRKIIMWSAIIGAGVLLLIVVIASMTR
jgi:hypothetical protein